MIEVPVFNQSGQEVEKLSFDEAKLGGSVNNALLKQAIVMYHANQRQGTVRTQARGEVAGSTRKLFKQKGTGNARTGGIRNPIKVGGGHAKARRAARNAALLTKIQANELRIIDDIKLDQPKTKLMAQVFKALKIDRTCLVAIEGRNESIERSARNIDRTTLTTVAQLNAWDILKNRVVLVTKAGFQAILEGDKKEVAASV